MKTHRIIDFHTHLGDIFHENQNITFKKIGSVKHPQCFDPFQDLEESGFTRPLIVPDQEAQNILIDAGQYRTWDRGSIFAHQEMMDACGGNYYMVSLPIMPNTSFEEAWAASLLEPRIIPFTCCDYGLPIDQMLAKLQQDIDHGAKGLKLHPIIQNVPLDDERTIEACKLFGERGLPITTHCGVNDYY